MPAMSVSVKSKTLFALEQAVLKTGWNKSRITDEALTRYLAELAEDEEDAKLGEEAYSRFLASGQSSVPAEQVYKELGL